VPSLPPGRENLLGKELSSQQVRIMKLLGEGLTTEQVATKMFLTVDTVKSHLRRAFRKMGVANRIQALLWCLKNGVVTVQVTNPHHAAPGFNGRLGPYPPQYRMPHTYARSVNSEHGACVCGAPFLHPVHVQAAPGVPMPGSDI
jgi:DNA-binding CsgD family transcriptional regulator